MINNAYKRVCDEVDPMIAEAFGFEWPKKDSPEQRAIKEADRRASPDGGCPATTR